MQVMSIAVCKVYAENYCAQFVAELSILNMTRNISCLCSAETFALALYSALYDAPRVASAAQGNSQNMS